MRDIIKKIPKRRGYGKNRGRTVVTRPRPVAVQLSKLSAFEAGSIVTPHALVEKGIVETRSAKTPVIKIVGGGAFDTKLSLKGVLISASSRAAIEKAGGSIL